MIEDSDIIADMIKKVMAVDPSFTQAFANEIEQQLRRDWGGERVTIARRAPILRKAREKVRQQIGIKPDKDIAEEHGISRRTLYRWIQK